MFGAVLGAARSRAPTIVQSAAFVLVGAAVWDRRGPRPYEAWRMRDDGGDDFFEKLVGDRCLTAGEMARACGILGRLASPENGAAPDVAVGELPVGAAELAHSLAHLAVLIGDEPVMGLVYRSRAVQRDVAEALDARHGVLPVSCAGRA